ncbi:uncharacterized protein BO95DRAFT_459507 [Aspergillus brunneoviolaceus CBS 621.78]|uniref:Uncharacterized protein n=1 Tax=Aspergillus brunneoviolaceus CBS 621.78 TaxID=1450534 RepID=A0ACD1GLL4_9EURO|nr:hypothetical protein BO95DRAFT_459507 [Aspergillus brunneoviolaceus CBS 621.78]RAH49999.1 hypothetical protein BO95DRAFT_459507 [Aspergillus brunneoviolaceus CBS 621.78]
MPSSPVSPDCLKHIASCKKALEKPRAQSTWSIGDSDPDPSLPEEKWPTAINPQQGEERQWPPLGTRLSDAWAILAINELSTADRAHYYPADFDHQGNLRKTRVPTGETFVFYAHSNFFFPVYRRTHILCGQSGLPFNIWLLNTQRSMSDGKTTTTTIEIGPVVAHSKAVDKPNIIIDITQHTPYTDPYWNFVTPKWTGHKEDRILLYGESEAEITTLDTLLKKNQLSDFVVPEDPESDLLPIRTASTSTSIGRQTRAMVANKRPSTPGATPTPKKVFKPPVPHTLKPSTTTNTASMSTDHDPTPEPTNADPKPQNTSSTDADSIQNTSSTDAEPKPNTLSTDADADPRPTPEHTLKVSVSNLVIRGDEALKLRHENAAIADTLISLSNSEKRRQVIWDNALRRDEVPRNDEAFRLRLENETIADALISLSNGEKRRQTIWDKILRRVDKDIAPTTLPEETALPEEPNNG